MCTVNHKLIHKLINLFATGAVVKCFITYYVNFVCNLYVICMLFCSILQYMYKVYRGR